MAETGQHSSIEEKVIHDVESEVKTPGSDSSDEKDLDPVVTFKTWVVAMILSIGYGLSFWPIPTVAAIGTMVSSDMGQPSGYIWFIPAWTIAITIGFMIFGPNTDLLGRRWFLVLGNLVCTVGHIVVGVSKNTNTIIGGLAVAGLGAANSQMVAFALPELLPNKWRHIGVVIADATVYVAVIVAPVTARYGNGLALSQVIREIDYLGAVLFMIGAVPALMGIVWAGVYSSSDAHVVAPLVIGFFFLICFALWETYGGAKHPLTPTYIFSSSWGRDFTAPAVALAVVNMFYYSSSILWPYMITYLYTNNGVNWKYSIALSLPQGFAILFGALLLSAFGSKLKHWQWQLTGSVFVMVLFGSLLGIVTPNNKGTMIAFIFLCQTGFGYALYLSIALCQMGVEQKDLGLSGGISGVFRFAAGAIGTAVYTTIFNNKLTEWLAKLVPKAAIAAGLPESKVTDLMSAVGTSALSTTYSSKVVAAVDMAVKNAYCKSFYVVALVSMAFGIVGIIACLCCKDVDKKMNNKIEVYLENTELADRNKYH
ncbi:MAG: peroxiredoxin prx5 [Cirrosporium novae-zelandiae]|nr:MAG: peroxiredoxin prx5 [Cirrosporium novae-zelandiae]